MKKTILVKEDGKVLLRVTLSGEDEIVQKAAQVMAGDIFYMSSTGYEIRNIINKKKTT